MATRDAERWDERYTRRGAEHSDAVSPPALFSPYAELFPRGGTALEIACGQGRFAVWLAERGMTVDGVDVSAVAVARAAELADVHGVAGRCRFTVADLDDGLPHGPPVDVMVCHLFRDRRLADALVQRLRPGGLLAVAVRSEVGAEPGPYRAAPGELGVDFAGLEPIADGEHDGVAWLLARR